MRAAPIEIKADIGTCMLTCEAQQARCDHNQQRTIQAFTINVKDTAITNNIIMPTIKYIKPEFAFSQNTSIVIYTPKIFYINYNFEMNIKQLEYSFMEI